MQQPRNYFVEEDLKRWGFSWRSFLKASFNRGITSFSISSVRSTDKSLMGKLLSSKGLLKLCDFFPDIINIIQFSKKEHPNIVNNLYFLFVSRNLKLSYHL